MGERLAWLWLIVAGILEIGWAVGMKYTQGWSRLLPSILVGAAYLACLYFLTLATRTLPIGTAYAVWVGLGAVGVSAWGIIFFGESAQPLRLACIALILIGVAGLKWIGAE